jgi:hypothetical protein
MKRILFVAKKNSDYGYSSLSGLFNSALFVVDMLRDSHVDAKFVSVHVE